MHQPKAFRGLNKDFKEALLKGRLNFILEYESEHRKTFLVEIRNNFLDLYFLGHGMEVKGTKKRGYYLSASDTFNPKERLGRNLQKKVIDTGLGRWKIPFSAISNINQFEEIMLKVLSKIVEHRKGSISEGVSEINHFIDNRAIVKNGILIVDRQVVYPSKKECRFDLLGLKRLSGNRFTFAVVELKNKNNYEIAKVFTQVKRYMDLLSQKTIYEDFRVTYEKVLMQKKELGLLEAIDCEIVPWSGNLKNEIEGVVILDNYDIKNDLKDSGLLEKAVKNWSKVKKISTHRISLFLKTNVLDSTLFLDINGTKNLLKKYKKCNS